MDNTSYFQNIADIEFDGVRATPLPDLATFGPRMQRLTNNIINSNFPIVSSLSLKYIDDELGIVLDMKKRTLKKLKNKYERDGRNTVNIVQDIYIDDFEMAVADNVQLVPDAQTSLMRTADDSNLIQIIIKNFEATEKGVAVDREFTKIYELLNDFRDNTFTKVQFTNTNQSTLTDDMINRIVRVWQVFDQYFKQFDYYDYLLNFNQIKNIKSTKFPTTILRVLMEVSPSE